VTSVLVHGVPETSAVWEPLVAALGDRDVVALQLPGFGCPRPDGFGGTKDEYTAWLVAELEGVDTPVDLVGHDWGGGFVVRLVSTRPELVRSWATDAAAVGDADFEWHAAARIWQTPGKGEEFFDRQLAASTEDLAAVYEHVGVPGPYAIELVRSIDTTMADCILDLYRSAVDVGREWSPDFRDVAVPGLVLLPSEDPYLPSDLSLRAAGAAGAATAPWPGLGHWWMLQDPTAAARTLTEFWDSVD